MEQGKDRRLVTLRMFTMHNKIISWNVRGLNDESKRSVINAALRKWSSQVVCLQETKIQCMDRTTVMSVGGGRWTQWVHLDAVGAAGGILVMWDSRNFLLIDSVKGSYSISCLFEEKEGGLRWIFTGVYGPCADVERSGLWSELSDVPMRWTYPWCIGGDFNAVRFPTERKGARVFSQAMMEFNDFINGAELMDLPLEGGTYTWSRNREGSQCSRIDRFLVSPSWVELFGGVTQSCLPRVMSDHVPLQLECGGIPKGKSPFRFEIMWMNEPGFWDWVKNKWHSYEVSGNPCFCFAKKLKLLKGDLRQWNRETVGNIRMKMDGLMEDLKVMDAKLGTVDWRAEDAERRQGIQGEIQRLLRSEEISWKQKSRIQWLKEGDNNTRFFHRMAAYHRQRNQISKVSINGELLEEKSEVRKGIAGFFEDLFLEKSDWKPNLDGVNFNILGNDEKESIESPFTEEEVWAAVRSLKGEKAPGPDGFPLIFFQKSWDFIKEELMSIFHYFYDHRCFEKSLNATFITLIPKRSGAVDIKDFRPISLVGSVYKIIAKVLASRLQRVVGMVVSPSQQAFVGGRQIMDAALIANEVLDWRLRSGEGGLLCKLDIEKAYDHVKWDFLFYLLQRMGFGERWRSWVGFCISSVRFSVLINGEPEGFFGSTRGLRQGDPISPLLFIIVMEALSKILEVTVQNGLIKGFEVGREGGLRVMVSHLFFADDTLVFCEAKASQLGYLRLALLFFQATSGLKVNTLKSVLYAVGEGIAMDDLASFLGCRVGLLPTSYLGLPLGVNSRKKEIWNPVIARFESRLAGWKKQYLSKGGRMVLIKSTLSSLPTYFMSLFSMPTMVVQRLEKLERDFLWEGQGEARKYHLVRWEMVCSSMSSGGLGLKRLNLFNTALLGKWLWKYMREESTLWKTVVMGKYGIGEQSKFPSEVLSSYGVGVWKGIRKRWDIVKRSVSFEVGNGNLVRFWDDRWCGDLELRRAFPLVYNLASNKGAKVCEVINFQGDNVIWNLIFRRNVMDWELQEVGSFFELLYTQKLDRNREDKVVWEDGSNGEFTVKSFYQKLLGNIDSYPWKAVWKNKAPSKVRFFVWEASLNAILTGDNLQRRGRTFVNWCCMCKCDAESVNHLLLHCTVARDLWDSAFRLFKVAWVMPETVKDMLRSWSLYRRKRRDHFWEVAPLVVCWIIWKERNNRIFENKERNMEELRVLFVQTLSFWCHEFLGAGADPFVEFVDNISSINVNENKEGFLLIESLGHAALVFLNKRLLGFAYGNHDDASFNFSRKISLDQGNNTLEVLSMLIGVQNYGPWFDIQGAGIYSVILMDLTKTKENLSSKEWNYQVGLEGESFGLDNIDLANSSLWTYGSVLPINQTLIWYKTTFLAPEGKGPLSINLASMGKGQAWVNGQSIGRYWSAYLSPSTGCTDHCDYRGTYDSFKCLKKCGQPAQTLYHIPRSWVHPGENLLVLHEELGGDPSKISFLTRTAHELCAYVSEVDPPPADSWEPHSDFKSQSPVIRLMCEPGSNITSIHFASFGTPIGDCGAYSAGSCHTDVLPAVQPVCIGKQGCSVPVSTANLGDPCPGVTKSLAIQAVCSA